MSPEEQDRDVVVGALASALLGASDSELTEHAAAAGEDIAEAAVDLRARFLERVEYARRRETDTEADTEAETDTDTDSEAETATEAEAEAVFSERDTLVSTSVGGATTPAPTAKQAGSSDVVPTRIGRYPLLRRLGSGGMGVVYAAYDELLDRRVALKILHDRVWDVDGRRRERLVREAQAMARVAHPNVVTVHEVGTTDDQLFVAMEFVEGPTLKEWLAPKPGQPRRSWREIVAMFCQIADGLAALHEAGLVHRDVKPANVIVGDDGRARVLDLGLVGAEDLEASLGAETPSLESSSSSLNLVKGALTRTGEFLGTPAYMSREQFLGLKLTPASDIFSFSVALYEALHGVHPFMDETFYELQSNVINARITAPSGATTVPTWLHNLVVRGLAPDPMDRPPSMRWYSAELSKDPSRVRRRWLGTIGFALSAALAGVLITRAQLEGPSAAPTCDGGEANIEKVWSAAQAQRVRAAMLASTYTYAEPLATRVIDDLDDYAARWIEAHGRACQEHARGEHSAALLDARVACLDRRRQALAETVGLLAAGGADTVARAGQMTARLPRPETCDDLAMLAGERRPTDPEQASAVAKLESQLVRAKALASAGRSDESIELTREVAREAEALGYTPTLARALLDEAEAALTLPRQLSSVAELLDRALALTIEDELDRLAAEAMTRRLHVRALTGDTRAAVGDIPIAAAMLARAGGDLELRALLFNNAGTIRLAAGDRAAALADFERSLELKRQAFGHDHLDVAVGLANLSMLTGDPIQRQEMQRRVLEIYEQRLGPEHPRTLDAGLLTAMYTADPERATTSLRDLCARLTDVGEADLAMDCELARGRLAYLRGQGDAMAQAFATLRASQDERSPTAILADAYLALGRDREAKDAAIESLAELIASLDDAPEHSQWWIRFAQAERRLILADLLRGRDAEQRLAQLELALSELESLADDVPPIEHERLLARTRVELAHALRDANTDTSRARALLTQARAHVQRWPHAYAAQLDVLDELEAGLD